MMFAPAFAPFANAEAIVNSKLALAMLEAGWEVDIISRDLKAISKYDYGSAWTEPWLPLRKHTYEISYALGNPISRTLDVLCSAIKTKYPFDGCRWVARAYDCALLLYKEKQYDFILSRAFPDYAHIPAMLLSRKTGVPWIANWNDPWPFLYQKKDCSRNLSKEPGKFYGKFCKTIVKHASGITFPSEILKKRMIPYLGDNVFNKSFVVPHVALPLGKAGTYEKKDIMNFCYAGKIWLSQNPTVMLKVLKKFFSERNLEEMWNFTFIGIEDIGLKNIIDELNLRNNFKNLGKQEYLETLKILAESDILIVVDPPETEGMLLTSKFVDYVQTGRPIWVISEKSGTLSNIISKYGGGIFADSSSIEDIERSLLIFYTHWKDCSLNQFNSFDQLYNLFSRDKIILKYKEIFSLICKKYL